MAAVVVATAHQPAYLPWLGFFHKLAVADVFVVTDTVKFSRGGLQNRNRIKGPNGSFWLTIPLRRNAEHELLHSLEIEPCSGSSRDWQMKHWRSIESCYAKAPYWHDYAPQVEEILLERGVKSFRELSLALIRRVASALGIRTEIVLASDLGCVGAKSDLTLDECRRVGADIYFSGCGGLDYLVTQDFVLAGVSVVFQDFVHPVYDQQFGDFVPNMSALDLLFNVGPGGLDVIMNANVSRADLISAFGKERGDAASEPSTTILRV